MMLQTKRLDLKKKTSIRGRDLGFLHFFRMLYAKHLINNRYIHYVDPENKR